MWRVSYLYTSQRLYEMQLISNMWYLSISCGNHSSVRKTRLMRFTVLLSCISTNPFRLFCIHNGW
jgi:hypothetical protein